VISSENSIVPGSTTTSHILRCRMTTIVGRKASSKVFLDEILDKVEEQIYSDGNRNQLKDMIHVHSVKPITIVETLKVSRCSAMCNCTWSVKLIILTKRCCSVTRELVDETGQYLMIFSSVLSGNPLQKPKAIYEYLR
jgi:hypothetical protein